MLLESGPSVLQQASPSGDVRARLMAASATTTLKGLANQWLETNIVWWFRGGDSRIRPPALLGRLRGAFGRVLMEKAPREGCREHLSTQTSPCAFEALFQKQGRLERGFELPAPWVIEADGDEGELVVRLRLFGFACDHADAAADAMTRALRTVVSEADNEFLEYKRSASDGLSELPLNAPLALRFVTPVVLTTANVTKKPQSLLTSFVARIAGLARWHDVTLSFDRTGFLSLASRLEFRWNEPRRIRWTRYSSRQRKIIPMSGVLGTLSISGPSEALDLVHLLLRFAARCHLGADVAFGCGRFRLETA